MWASGVWASGFWADGFWVDTSGNASNFWASNFWADGFWADGFWSGLEGPVIPPVTQQQTPAGGRSRRRYTVRIGEREFEVESPAHAEALLDLAREEARKAAERQAERVVAKALPRARVTGRAPVVTLEVPRVTGSNEIRDAVQSMYAEVAQEAELRLLLQLEAERDDEELLLL